MTIIHKRIEFTSLSGLVLFIEQYSEKPNFVKFWRYGCGVNVWSDMLLCRPNKRKLIDNY